MAELADFEPSTGHRHDCSEHVCDRACDCASDLYAIAQDAERARDERERRVMQTLPPRSMDIHLSPPAPHPVVDPCAVGIHQFAWLNGGGMQCTRCRRRP